MATARCSFCSRSADSAGSIVAGPRGVGICGECAALAAEVAVDAIRPSSSDRLITRIGRVMTNDHRHGDRHGWIDRAAVAVRRGRVTWVGPERDLPDRYRQLPELDAGGAIVCPGFVDAGTHLLGAVTVDTADAAVAGAAGVASAMLQRGVTSFDLSAGGSTDPMLETVSLAAARATAERVAASVSVTWRVAVGSDCRELRRVVLPAASRLAANVAVQCDGSPGSVEESIRSLRPLRPRITVCDEPDDCLDAAEGALSIGGAGHHSAVDGVVSVVEPARLLDGHGLASRKLWDAGAVVAIASGNDPARRVVESPGLLLTLLVEVGGLTIDEAMWTATRGGALALGDPERGRLRPGDVADLVVLAADDAADLVARPDANWASMVVVGGIVMST